MPGYVMIAEYLLSAFAFLVGFAPCLSIATANFAWVGFLAMWLATRLVRRENPILARTPFDPPILAFLAVWLVSTFFGLSPLQSFKTLPSQFHFVVFYLLVWVDDGRHARKALFGCLWGAGLAVVYGLAQYGLWHFVYPQGEPPWLARLSPIWQGYVRLYVGRVHGAVYPLTYAEVILPLAIFLAAFYLNAERMKRAFLWLGAFTGTAIALLLSQSRGPWLGAAGGLTALEVFHRRRWRLLIPMAVIPLLFLNGDIRGRAGTFLNLEEDSSTTVRLAYWQSALHISGRYPLVGVGTGQIYAAAARHRGDPEFPPLPPTWRGNVHNMFLQHLLEKGIIGLLIFIWLLSQFVIAGWHAWRRARGGPDEILGLALFCSFVAFPIINLTERAFDDAEVSLVFWTLAAAAVVMANAKRARTDQSPITGPQTPDNHVDKT
ncbi:MAG: O-antigen ligase family protein [Planctomycetota bacterium]